MCFVSLLLKQSCAAFQVLLCFLNWQKMCLSSHCWWNETRADRMHRLSLICTIQYAQRPVPKPSDISCIISADIWRNRMVSGQVLPVWSMVDKKRWQSLEFVRSGLSVALLFQSFIQPLSFSYTALTSISDLCRSPETRAVDCLWEDRRWRRSGDQSVCVLGGCEGVTKPRGWSSDAGCHATGQRVPPPVAPMISPAWQPFDGEGDTLTPPCAASRMAGLWGGTW